MTNMTRWDPIQEAVTLREAVNRLFEESFVPAAPTRSAMGVALDLSETADSYMIEAAVPGLKAEDLNVTFENGVLVISGEIRQSEESKDRTFHRIERRFGHFSRSIALPTTVRGDAITARMEHGVLLLNVPKAEEVKPRKITVSVN
jgi:HSP20 family protein